MVCGVQPGWSGGHPHHNGIIGGDKWCAVYNLVGRGPSSPLRGSIAGLHRLSWLNLGKSKQETNGRKIPVIGSKVKVSITPRAAVIQCRGPNPAESSSWCCDPWSSGRAYGLVTENGI